MDIRPLTPDYAVSPQIGLEDLAAIRAAGFAMVIDNRPDAEIPAELHTDGMRRAALAAGATVSSMAGSYQVSRATIIAIRGASDG